MSVLTCKMCGGDLNPADGMTTARCPYCGTNQTIPRLGSEKRIRLYDRANHFRRRNDYDMAMELYEQILNDDATDSEAYWSLVLCRYGIEYVEDPATHKRIPTVNRTQNTSILADEDYRAALRYADAVSAKLYEEEAARIDAIQQGILQVSQKEAPYDIFICYKEADDNGERTRDSVLADEVYYHLSREGYRVFFSRITLQDKLGEAYEPYIFAALRSAKVMIVIGTDPRNFQSVWVRNEWSRYLSFIRKGEAKVLIPAYRDMDPYDLPKEFSHLQALNMAQLGFMQDLLHGVEKIIKRGADTGIPAENAGGAVPLNLADAERIDYQIIEPAKIRKNGWEPYGWKRGVAIGFLLIAAALLVNGWGIYQRLKMNQEEKAANAAQTEQEASSAFAGLKESTEEAQKEQTPILQGILAEFVSRVYQVPAKDVTEGQLAKIQQLTVRREFDIWHVGYSYEAPGEPVFPITESGELFQNSAEGLTWIDFSSDAALDLEGLVLFSGLKRLDVCGVLSASDIKGLPLVSVSAYFDDPAQAASILENPGAITELGFNGGLENLKGIQQFENLETLYVDYADIDNIDALINLKHLKNLTLYCEENLKDFAVIGKLPELETLRLETYGLRGTDFLKNLTNLKQLEIIGAQIHMLSGLENCSALETLSIAQCMELKNLIGLETLTGLQELALDVPYGCQEPDLHDLTSLKKLSLSGVEDCSYIENLTALTELHLDGCALPENVDPSKLTSLTTLSITFEYHSQEPSVIEKFPALERINLQGLDFYQDISGIFNMPHLRELNLDDVNCEINFDAVKENPSLEILHMNNVFLYKNVKIYQESFITSMDYDEVSLEDHTAFFYQFPALKELYVSGNGLTDVSFARDLPALEVLDISDNYITSLSPLAGLPSLKKVVCADNPLETTEGLGNSVLVIDQPLTE